MAHLCHTQTKRLCFLSLSLLRTRLSLGAECVSPLRVPERAVTRVPIVSSMKCVVGAWQCRQDELPFHFLPWSVAVRWVFELDWKYPRLSPCFLGSCSAGSKVWAVLRPQACEGRACRALA